MYNLTISKVKLNYTGTSCLLKIQCALPESNSLSTDTRNGAPVSCRVAPGTVAFAIMLELSVGLLVLSCGELKSIAGTVLLKSSVWGAGCPLFCGVLEELVEEAEFTPLLRMI